MAVRNDVRFTAEGDRVPSEVPSSVAVGGELESGAQVSYHLSSQVAFGSGDTIAIHGSQGALTYEMFTDELCGATEGGTQISHRSKSRKRRYACRLRTQSSSRRPGRELWYLQTLPKVCSI